MGRLIFLGCIQDLSPATWNALEAEVLPAYVDFTESVGPYRDGLGLPQWTEDALEKLAAYWDALRAWQRRWHLTDDWLATEAEKCLVYWSRYGPDRSTLLLGVFSSNRDALDAERELVRSLGIEPPAFPHLAAWNPVVDGWIDYRDRTLKHIDAELEDYRAAVLASDGLKKWKLPRRRSGTTRDQHFRWLVRFQVLEEREESIARDAKGGGRKGRVDPRSVQAAIKEKAELIGLTRRPPLRGFPEVRDLQL